MTKTKTTKITSRAGEVVSSTRPSTGSTAARNTLLRVRESEHLITVERTPEEELVRQLALLRIDMCDEVATTDFRSEAHRLAMRVWKFIERIRPQMTPSEWRARAGLKERQS